MTDCDILIAGAGSAGCVVASQLLRRLGLKVMLVEPDSGTAPPLDRLRPARWLRLLNSSEAWNLPTGNCAGLAGRSIVWPRGRGLGGSSRINAMIWFPPTKADLGQLSRSSGGRWSLAGLSESLAGIEALVQPESPAWISESSQRFLRAAAGQ
ncbi:MAG: GMC family oxidoreductase N-terminal domain-containing protein [Pirellulales bacterium]|nr:GMC family oxidoreductase N-terminal domain-containing protein [Pirellulales bacterium]